MGKVLRVGVAHGRHRRHRAPFGIDGARVHRSELEALLEAGSQEVDAEKRAAIYAKIQRVVLDRTYAIPTYVLKYNVATSQSVRDVAIDVNGFPVFYDTWIAR